jgi:hypothetical protein
MKMSDEKTFDDVVKEFEALCNAHPEEVKRHDEEVRKKLEIKYPILKVRYLLEDKVREAGGDVCGGGFGLGGADFEFHFEGQHYWIDIRQVVDEESE